MGRILKRELALWLAVILTSLAAPGISRRQMVPRVGTYTFVEESLSWSDAYRHCRESNGSLAVGNSPTEWEALGALATQHGAQTVHVGFSDQHVEGSYYSVHGRPVDAECGGAWAPGAPVGGPARDCGGLGAEGLTDVDCAIPLPSICELQPWEGFGYEELEGLGFYKHHRNQSTWPVAWQKCQEEGAHLVVLNSEAELTTLHQRYLYTWVWAGAHHHHADQLFVTVFGQPLETTGFLRWREGDPAGNNVTQPYLAIQTTDGLYTSRGDAKREFICEHEYY